MTREGISKTAALIITAGRTARGDAFEPGKEVGSLPAVQRAAMVFRRAGIERIVVVCGQDGGKTEKLAARMDLVFLRCAGDPEMLDCVKAGLAYLTGKCGEVLISPVDVPLFSTATVRRLMAAGGGVCVPVCRGQGGHPLLLGAEYFPAVLAYHGGDGLAGAVRAAGLHRREVEVEDEGVLANVRRGGPYPELVAGHDLSELRPVFTFRLAREQVFYGPGVHQLLGLTEETGSLLAACRRMGLSYSKGRKIIAVLDSQLGCPALETQQGGKTGGRSLVTGEARKLMDKYERFCAEAREQLGQLFQRHFDGCNGGFGGDG